MDLESDPDECQWGALVRTREELDKELVKELNVGTVCQLVDQQSHVMITNVWNQDHIAFVPLDEFKEKFLIDGIYTIINENLFGTPFNSADTYMQSYMLGHARSSWSLGMNLDVNIKGAYIWREAERPHGKLTIKRVSTNPVASNKTEYESDDEYNYFA